MDNVTNIIIFTTNFTIVKLTDYYYFLYEFIINTILLSTINNISPQLVVNYAVIRLTEQNVKEENDFRASKDSSI